MSETLMVTGAAGFIGSSLIEKLVTMGYDIVGIDRVGDPIKLGQLVEKINYIKVDVRNSKALARVLERVRPRGIIHLAAVSRVVWCRRNVQRCADININGTISILKSMINTNNNAWFIYGSSREVYGEPKSMPVKEDDPKQPINIYGYTKLISEKIVQEYSIQRKIPSIILRFSNVYGNERDIYDRVIPKFIIRALKGLPLEIHGGGQVFDFTFIDDTVNGIIKAIEKLTAESFVVEDFHILTGRPTPLRMLPTYISKIIGKKVNLVYKPRRTYDVEKFYGDPSKAREKLGFSASVYIEEGLKRTVDRLRRVIL